MISPPIWTSEELDESSKRAEEHFRESRHKEPLEAYLDLFDEYRGIVEEVMEQTVDLTRIEDHALDLLIDDRKREVFRYLTGPPVSEDDLKVLTQARSLAPSKLPEDPELMDRLVAFIRDWHDRRRFPWVGEGWEPTEHDREAAVLATSALLAMRRVETMRRNEGKDLQEALVAAQLRLTGFAQVKTRKIRTIGAAPGPGEFCRESTFGNRKADFVIGLWDERIMPLECKVSNSSTNSIKRLNNDAAAKAEAWKSDFGTLQVVPAAVLGGVYNLRNLEDAQNRGLTIFWSHDLQGMLNWIERTKGERESKSSARRAAEAPESEFGSGSN